MRTINKWKYKKGFWKLRIHNFQKPFSIVYGVYYPPKLSYIIDSGSTPSPSSIFKTALLIGPGPHI